MKKLFILALALIGVMAVVAFAGVSGTVHDLSSGGGEICVACHTPHGAVPGDGPLWNRSQGTQTYTRYTSSTSSTFEMINGSLLPQSLACLTCHNGVASTLVNYPGPGSTPQATYDLSTNEIGTSNAFAQIGLDLSNDHPVGFAYDPSDDGVGAGGSAVNGFPALSGKQVGTTGMLVYGAGNQMECATCHDVHNQAVPSRSPVYFLRMTNTNSAMCLACHTAK